MVKKNTDIVIEGFPRSGNTFCVVALSEYVSRRIRIAHHTHAPVQFRVASRYRIPSMVLLRNPVDSIKSLKIMYPRLTITTIARGYYEFYTYILEKTSDVKILPFDVLITDFEKVADQLKKELKLDFNESGGKMDAGEIFGMISKIKGLTGREYRTQVSVPVKIREEQKKKILVDPNNIYVKRSLTIYNKLFNKSDF